MDRARNRISQKWVRIAAVVLAIPGCYLAYLLGIALGPVRTQAEVPPTTPPLFIPLDRLSLGEMWESPTHTVELPVENRSSRPIEVTEWTPACSCSGISVEPGRITIAAGETVHIRVQLDLTTRSGDSQRAQTKDFQTSLVARSGSEPVSPRWVIRGTIRVVLGALPKQLACNPNSDLASTAEPTLLDLSPSAALRKVTAEVDPPWATAEVQPIEGTDQLRVAIRPKLPAAIGDLPATLRLLPADQQGDALPPREVKLVLRGLTDVQPDLPRVLLGTLSPNETGTAEVGFRSLTGSAFEVEPASPTSSGIVVERRGGSDSRSFGITVHGVSGSQVIPVEFRVRQPNRAEYSVRFEIAYHGVAR